MFNRCLDTSRLINTMFNRSLDTPRLINTMFNRSLDTSRLFNTTFNRCLDTFRLINTMFNRSLDTPRLINIMFNRNLDTPRLISSSQRNTAYITIKYSQIIFIYLYFLLFYPTHFSVITNESVVSLYGDMDYHVTISQVVLSFSLCEIYAVSLQW
jgi:hypothetical protein